MTGRCMDSSTVEMIRQESNVVELLEKRVKTARLVRALQRVLNSHPATGGVAEA